MSSWASIANKSSDKPVTTTKKKEVEKPPPPKYNFKEIFEEEVGDPVFNELNDYYLENYEHNYLLSRLGGSNLYSFFLKYVNLDTTVQGIIDDYEEDKDNKSESEDDDWYY
jgi:hypothetical protein